MGSFVFFDVVSLLHGVREGSDYLIVISYWFAISGMDLWLDNC